MKRTTNFSLVTESTAFYCPRSFSNRTIFLWLHKLTKEWKKKYCWFVIYLEYRVQVHMLTQIRTSCSTITHLWIQILSLGSPSTTASTIFSQNCLLAIASPDIMWVFFFLFFFFFLSSASIKLRLVSEHGRSCCMSAVELWFLLPDEHRGFFTTWFGNSQCCSI